MNPLFFPSSRTSFSTITVSKNGVPHKFLKISASSPSATSIIIRKSLPIVASLSLLLSATPANAGFMSGFSGLESVPGPELPRIDFLNRFNGFDLSPIVTLISSSISVLYLNSYVAEENQKKYAENDERFKSSPILKELLERSKQNKDKNRQGILDKYCVRGAEWGVGDCSTVGMTVEEKDNFVATLKQKVGIKD